MTMTTLWIIVIALVILTFVESCCVVELNKRIDKTNEVLSTSLASLGRAVSDLTVTVEDNSNFIMEIRNSEDPVEKQIKEAKQKVMSEYIDGIVNYSPFGKE